MNLRKRAALWKEAFETDDNAVLPTLINFAWNHASFLTIARAIDLAPVDDEGNKRVNPLLFGLLQSAYWGSAVLAVRRLVDGGSLHGKHGVNSLGSILQDVKECRRHITRRAYVEILAGLEYDSEAIEARAYQFMMARDGQPTYMPRELQATPSRQRHEEFDYLSGVAPGDRTPEDLIRPQVFQSLQARLARIHDVSEHASIHFAHAATAQSRAGRGLRNGWNTEDATDAFKGLVQVGELIGRWFVYSGVGDVLPTAQFDQFAHLDEALVAPENLAALRQAWDEFADATDQWPRLDDAAV